jgi:hypothetical protein
MQESAVAGTDSVVKRSSTSGVFGFHMHMSVLQTPTVSERSKKEIA